jgi:hypothetical protein
MKNTHPTNHLHDQGNVKQLVTPQMRQQVVRVKRQLDEHAGYPSKSLKTSPCALVDWGRVLRIMSDKLKFCTSQLSKQRQSVRKIERKYFPPEATGKKPSIEALETLAYAFADSGFFDVVKCLERLEEFRGRAFLEVGKILYAEEKDDHKEDDDWFDPFEEG